jgi:hypothetical protein
MSYSSLLTNLGFDADPFAKTNADEEDRLEEYFVPPPFFRAVYGDHRTPKSAIVFAPRGGGKTALKRKIEIAMRNQPILCISYNHFNITNTKLTQIDSQYHLRHLVQLVLVGVLSRVYLMGVDDLSNDDRHLLYLLANDHLSKIDRTELRESIESIKNLSDKSIEMWNRFTGPVALVVNALLERMGFGKAELKKYEDDDGAPGSLTEQLRTLQLIGVKIGYKGVYVLIDRIDETSLTSTVGNSYRFIAPLVNDLHLLEMPGFAFKFFLWDLLLPKYREVARPDRVKAYSLGWDYDDLQIMLSARLKAYTNKRILSFGTIANSELPLPIDQVIAIFAQGSPRNLIRICKEILDQQSEMDHAVKEISNEAIEMGLQRIADGIAHEMYSDSVIKELQRTKRCDFTIRHIYTDVFKFTQQAALNKVRSWENINAVRQLGTVQETENTRASYHYGVANVLLAKHIFSQMSVKDFITHKIKVCAHCRKVVLRDWDLRSPQRCHHCQQEMSHSRWKPGDQK